MSSAGFWALGEADARRIHGLLATFLQDAGARTALLVDRNGQMVLHAGELPSFDHVAFASLTAADFSANDQLARMLGESEFGTLFHQGERESLFLADVARRLILVVLFDTRTTLGLVKLRVRRTVRDLSAIVEELFAREGGAARVEAAFLGEAEDEIDRLFGPM
jgi:predicted regulator of Ras-like GTPase activity (Roadblock/LC7/MglB family)